MQVKDLAVVMLAAGSSKRFDANHRTTHKSLLKIDEKHSIFDIILNGLLHNDVSRLLVILGYKAQKFQEYLANKKYSNMKTLQMNQIVAQGNFVKGPVFTLLSLLFSEFSNLEKFVVIPSDTIFHPLLLKQILSCSVEESPEICKIFTISQSLGSKYHFINDIAFSPQLIDERSSFYSLLEENVRKSERNYIVPILILTRSYLEYVNNTKNRISTKIIENLAKYYEECGRCSISHLNYSLTLPPFIDIDTSHIYNSLHSVKREIFEPYKVKF